MNSTPRSLCRSSLVALFWAFALIGANAAAAQPAADGSVSGTVNNANSGNLLQGAKVEIPALGLVALTD